MEHLDIDLAVSLRGRPSLAHLVASVTSQLARVLSGNFIRSLCRLAHRAVIERGRVLLLERAPVADRLHQTCS